MFSSRLFLGLLIPLIILGFGIWFAASADIDRGSVRVAGALVSAADVELSVKKACITEEEGVRKLVLEFDVRNICGIDVNLNPRNFQLLLIDKTRPASMTAQRGTFQPMHFTSVCDAAPNDIAKTPPNAVRSFTLRYWGATLPHGDEWKDYLLSLEYYDPATPLMISKPINPEEK